VYRNKQLLYENSIIHKLWYEDRQFRLEKLKKILTEYTDINIKMLVYEALQDASKYTKADCMSVMRYWNKNDDKIQREVQIIENELSEYANEKGADCIWVREFLKWQMEEQFCDDAVSALIDKVELSQNGLRVKFKFGNPDNMENRNLH
jgi:hypothetical protein